MVQHGPVLAEAAANALSHYALWQSFGFNTAPNTIHKLATSTPTNCHCPKRRRRAIIGKPARKVERGGAVVVLLALATCKIQVNMCWNACWLYNSATPTARHHTATQCKDRAYCDHAPMSGPPDPGQHSRHHTPHTCGAEVRA